MKINRGKYYYDFLHLSQKILAGNPSCHICGSTRNVSLHHIERVKESDKKYALRDNIVVLCKKHHKKFHVFYGSGKGVNRKNWVKFCNHEYRKLIKKQLKEINKLEEENITIKEANGELNNRLEYVEQTIGNAIETERTELGSRVLRNLAENLGVEIE